MKRIALALMVIVLALYLMACGNETLPTGSQPTQNTQQTGGTLPSTQPTTVITQPTEPEHIHEWSEATCTLAKTCKTCGETDGEALGHNWQDATCTTPKTCLTCNTTEGEVLDHTWDNGVILKEATEDADGEMEFTCTACGEKKTQVIPSVNHEHNYSNTNVTKPTCTEEGYTTYTCKCGDSYVADKTAALGHDWAAATCTEPKTCMTCGATEGTENGHNWNAATCTTSKTCAICGATEGSALGHNWAEANCTEPKTCMTCGSTEGIAKGHIWNAATCTTPKTCATCGATDGVAIGHTETIDAAVEATCTATGLTEGKHCSVCSMVIVAQTVVPAKGHVESDWIIDEEATYTTTGRKHKECTVCYVELERKTIPLKSYSDINSAATALREAMVNRRPSFSLNYQVPDASYATAEDKREALANAIRDLAFIHTGNPKEGDYLKIGNSVSIGDCEYQLINGEDCIVISYNLFYSHTLQEENELDDFVKSLFDFFSFTDDTTDYEKIYAIYSYVCENVDYDYTYSNATAYGGLIEGSTICQGYALIMYRLLLEANIDCRFIGGYAYTGEGHAWNIVQLDGLYYNIDATWDEGNTDFIWFLVSPESFIGHTRENTYNTPEFCLKYIMSSSDYTHQHDYVITTVAPTCDYFGYDDYCCSICGEGYRSNYVESTGHAFVNGICHNCNITVEEAPNHIVATGTCGNDVCWKLDAGGTLTIFGTGTINSFPWYSYCPYINRIVIEEGISQIADNAFNGMTDLESISLPNSIQTIGAFAFANCYNLKEVILPEGIDKVSNSLFENCYNLECVVIPIGVKYIGYASFYNCYKLNNIQIPNSVTDILSFAFAFCTNLTEIELSEGLIHIYGWAFNGCTALREITIPDGVVLIGGSAFWNCENLVSIDLPDSIQEIQSSAFLNCYQLVSLTIPEGVTIIPHQMLKNCTSLTSVIMHDRIQKIESSAFEGCTSLKEITIPNSVTDIAEYAFMYCSELEEVTIGNGLENVGMCTFSNCPKLATIYYLGTIAQWNNISKGAYWSSSIAASEVICADGTVSLESPSNTASATTSISWQHRCDKERFAHYYC